MHWRPEIVTKYSIFLIIFFGNCVAGLFFCLISRIRKTFKQVAKKMGKKPKEVCRLTSIPPKKIFQKKNVFYFQITYVGMHNRRTDSIEFIKRGWHQVE